VTLLSIVGLRGGYGDVDILNGVDLTLNPGEVLTVAGTNGAGKSIYRVYLDEFSWKGPISPGFRPSGAPGAALAMFHR